jgi:3-hydroxyacyl-CoA dehydrogenase/enoyl-CoA hydratase/carnithine racemase
MAAMKTDYSTIKVELKDNVAVLTLDNPPVNQMSPQLMTDFKQAVGEALEDVRVKAIVVTGVGKNFIAGADITQFKLMKKREDFFQKALTGARFLNSIEAGPKPFIAAINGNCLGGGLETAMACHYRVAAQGVDLGQPEVQIGLIPGAGGTQRLPRLIGLPNALEMITTGKSIKAELALQRALVDEVVPRERLLEAAVKAAQRFVKGELNLKLRMTRNVIHRIPSAAEKTALLGYAKLMTYQKAKGYLAPFKAIDAFEQGLGYNIEADIEKEVGLFADCAVSHVAKNLINIFLNTRSAGRLKRIEGVEPAKIKRVAMLGGGVMGSGIVNLLLQGRFDTILWDIDEQAVQKGLSAVRKTFAYAIKTKQMTEKDLGDLMSQRLITTTSLQDLKDVDLVIEAVLEDMKVKQDIWLSLEKICPSHAVFGTNTSALPITEMAEVLKDPGRMIGLHFFNPADRMQLLEVICAKKTSDQTLAASVAFARAIKKIPIVVNDGPGFYVSRQLGGLMGGAVFLTADGVDGAFIEEAMIDFGMPMGPATLADLTGIDINYHVNRTFEKRLGERWRVNPLTEVVYRTGCYGRKTGAGYFDYSGEKPVPNQKVVDAIRQYLKENNVTPKEVSRQEVVDLMLANGINEAAYMIQEGICDRPQDMDLAMIYGTGFPPYRGGILRYADQWGLKTVYAKLLELEKQYGVRFKPAELIKDMAESGKTFYSGD